MPYAYWQLFLFSREKQNLKVIVNKNDPDLEREFGVAELAIHPDIKIPFDGRDNNIMVLKIIGVVDISNPKITPVCLPTSPLDKMEGIFVG